MPIIQAIIKRIIYPISRYYTRNYINDKPADSLLEFLSKIDFWSVHKYWPSFRKPKSFSEKIYSRMLFNRDPKLTLISDKLAVRDYVQQKIGNEYTIPILWNGKNAEEIPFGDLPEKYVIKTNHGCAYNIIVQNKKLVNERQIIFKIKKMLEENFCTDKFLGTSWAYKNIDPKIMIECFIGENCNIPEDYKFFCFSGRAEYVLISFDRYKDHKEKHFTRDFRPINVWNGLPQKNISDIQKPKNFMKMLHIADKLGNGFDFMRVDLYNINGKIYFGELTCYPGGGRAKFVPKKYDYKFGEKWI